MHESSVKPAPPTRPASGAPTEDELQPGDVLAGRYTVEHLLGAGGVATVYACHDAKTDQRIALKVLAADRHNDDRERARFENELRVGSSLRDHPNLVRPFALGELKELGGRLFLASELVAGPTLADLVISRGLPEARACALIRGVATGLRELHEAGFLHRDVKPSNVIVDPGNDAGDDDDDGAERARLFDFGYAIDTAHVRKRTPDRLTEVDERPGTKHYMAPECVVGAPATEPSDVYALAVTLYELLAQEPPFHHLSPVDAARRKADANEPEPRIEDAGVSVSAGVASLINDGLRREAVDRIPSAEAFLARLDRLGQLASVEAKTTSAPSPRAAGSLRGVTAGLVVVVLGGLGYWAWNSLRQTTPREGAHAVASETAVGPSEPEPRERARAAVVAPAAMAAAEDLGASAPPPVPADVPPVPQPLPADTQRQPQTPPAAPAPTLPPPATPVPPPKQATAPSPTAASVDCDAEREAARIAYAARDWKAYAKRTKRSKCWPTKKAWLRERVVALYQSKAYNACIKAAAKSSDPEVRRYSNICQAKKEREE